MIEQNEEMIDLNDGGWGNNRIEAGCRQGEREGEGGRKGERGTRQAREGGGWVGLRDRGGREEGGRIEEGEPSHPVIFKVLKATYPARRGRRQHEKVPLPLFRMQRAPWRKEMVAVAARNRQRVVAVVWRVRWLLLLGGGGVQQLHRPVCASASATHAALRNSCCRPREYNGSQHIQFCLPGGGGGGGGREVVFLFCREKTPLFPKVSRVPG